MGTLFVITFELFGVSNMERIEANRTIWFRYCHLPNGTEKEEEKTPYLWNQRMKPIGGRLNSPLKSTYQKCNLYCVVYHSMERERVCVRGNS